MRKAIRWLTLARLIPLIAILSVFLLATRTPLDTDTFWHLRAGEWQVTERALLRTDLFSHTRYGQPWINHSWLSQIILYGMYAGLGELGLALLTSLLAAGGMIFVYHQCEGDPIVRAFAVILGAMAATIFWSPRPQMLSFFLSTIVLYLLWLSQKKGIDRLWLIPPVMILWANLHGGFAIGFILMVLATVGDALRWLVDGVWRPESEDDNRPSFRPVLRLAIIGLVSAAAISLNPYGPAVIAYPFRTVGIGSLREFIAEWSSPDFHNVQTWPFVWLLLGTLVATGLSPQHLDWRDAVMVTGTAYSALLAVRNVAVFAIVCIPVLTFHLSAWLDSKQVRLNWNRLPSRGLYTAVNWLLALVMAAGAVGRLVMLTSPAVLAKEYPANLPVGAVEYLETHHPPGPMFNSYNWGGYLIWAARDYPVYVDGRTDLYDDELLSVYREIIFALPGWEEHLDRAGINLVLVQRGTFLADRLAATTGWTQVYEDQVAVIFTRDEPLEAQP